MIAPHRHSFLVVGDQTQYLGWQLMAAFGYLVQWSREKFASALDPAGPFMQLTDCNFEGRSTNFHVQISFSLLPVFSRVHATLQPALSVRPSVGWSVCWSITLLLFLFILFFFSHFKPF